MRVHCVLGRARSAGVPGGILLLAWLALASAPTRAGDGAAAGNEIVYAGDAQFFPYEFLDGKGEPAGLNVDLIRAVARAQRLDVRIRLEPWARVRADLAAGAADVSAMYRSAQRAREVARRCS